MSLNRSDPPGMAPVADLLGMDRTTLTAALKPLERRGLLKITPIPPTAAAACSTSPQGQNPPRLRRPLWERTSKQVEGLLGDSNPDRLRQSLRSLS